MTELILEKKIEGMILMVRGHKVMLDTDLATLYGVTTKRLNEQVKRNRDRFPAEFMIHLTEKESAGLMRSQNATGSRRNIRYRPYAFTEHGAVMLASVLNSAVAVQTSIQVVKAFVRLRHILATHQDLARRLHELEKKYDSRFSEHTEQIRAIFEAIQALLQEPMPAETEKRPIGFLKK